MAGPVPAPILAACGLTFVLYLGAYMRLPLVPLFARDLGADTVQVGLINAGFMAAATALSLPLGLVSDRVGRRRLILAGVAVSALTSGLLLAARTPGQVGAIYLFAGVGLACFSPAMMSYVGDVSPPEALGRSYGWYTAALYLGMAAGPGIGGAVAAGGIRRAFLGSALVVALGLAAAGPRLPAPPAAAPSRPTNLAAAFREVASNRRVLACWTVTFFATYAWGALFAFFPLYAREAGIPVGLTGLIFSCQAAANAAARIPVGHFQDRTGRRDLYVAGGNLLFSLAVAAVGSTGSAGALALLFLAAGSGMAATFTGVGAILSGAVESRVRGLAMGGYNTCIYGGFAASAATLGPVIQRFGFPAGFAAAGIVSALSVPAFLAVSRTGATPRFPAGGPGR